MFRCLRVKGLGVEVFRCFSVYVLGLSVLGLG